MVPLSSHDIQLAKERKKIARGVWLNLFLILTILLFLVYWTLPGYEDLSAKIDSANDIIKDIKKLDQSGISAKNLETILNNNGTKIQTMTNGSIFKNNDTLQAILTMPASVTGSYLAWLKKENETDSVADERIQNNLWILTNIIPNFSTNLDQVRQEKLRDQKQTRIYLYTLSLKSLIQYVETKLLNAYGIESYIPIGIDAITFEKNKFWDPSIGTFTMTIGFTNVTNASIMKLINHIQSSGVVTSDEKGNLVSPSRSKSISDDREFVPDNLLITIDKLTLSSLPYSFRNASREIRENYCENTATECTTKNSGSITLRFYVKGIGSDQVMVVRARLADRIANMRSIANAINTQCTAKKECQKSIIKDSQKLLLNVEEINKQINALRNSSNENDLNKDADKLFTMSAILDSYEIKMDGYAKSAGTILPTKN